VKRTTEIDQIQYLSVVRFTDSILSSALIPALKCWATIRRPLRGLVASDVAVAVRQLVAARALLKPLGAPAQVI
jgi:hypothetical protein